MRLTGPDVRAVIRISLSASAEVRHVAGLFILGVLVFSPVPMNETTRERWVVFLTAVALIAPEILKSLALAYRQLRGLPDPTPPRPDSSPTDGENERGA